MAQLPLMIRDPRCVLMLWAGLGAPLLSVSQNTQWQLDPAASGIAYTQGSAAADDGSLYMHQLVNDTGRFLRLNAAGIVSWERVIAPDPFQTVAAPAMTTLPGGDLLVAIGAGVQQGQTRVDLVRTDGVGDAVFAQRMLVPGTGARIQVRGNAAGAWFVAAADAITKFDGGGTPLWSVRVWGMDTVTSLVGLRRILPDAAGGCVFMGRQDDLPTDAIVVGRLDAQGVLQWASYLLYEHPNAVVSDPDLALGADDHVTLVARLDLLGQGARILTHRLDPAGTWLRSELYDLGHATTVLQAIAWQGDEVLLHAWTGMWDHSWLIRTDGTGTVLEALRTRLDTVNDHQVRTAWYGLDVAGGQVRFAGDRVDRHVVFGHEERRPMAWGTTGSFVDLCYLDPAIIQHDPAQSSLVTQVPLGYAQPVSIAMQPVNVLHQPAVVPGVSEFCNSLGTQEALSDAGIRLHPNPAQDHITLIAEGFTPSSQWRILTATGQQVANGHLGAQPLTLDITTLPAGVLLLEVSAPDGARQARMRFVHAEGSR